MQINRIGSGRRPATVQRHRKNIPRQQKRQRLGKVSSEVVALPAVSSEIVSLGVNIVTSSSKTNESSENGPMLRINVSSESSKWEYRYRFWGIPYRSCHAAEIGCQCLADDNRTIRSLRFTIRSSSRANGTKVIKATSLVISMLEKKHRRIRSCSSCLSEWIRSSSNSPELSKETDVLEACGCCHQAKRAGSVCADPDIPGIRQTVV